MKAISGKCEGVALAAPHTLSPIDLQVGTGTHLPPGAARQEPSSPVSGALAVGGVITPPAPPTLSVLDHGFVRLVNYMGDDLSIVRAARVSYDAAWRAGDDTRSDARLIRYLMRHRHSTPFEAVEFQFDVKAPIFVMRQWMRHRTWTYNEVSARYTELPSEFYVPDPSTVGCQSTVNKQGRQPTDIERTSSVAAYESRCRAAFREYEWLLAQDWPRELARCVLPLSTYTHLFAKVNLWNLFHFLGLRLDSHAQYEIRRYAEAILTMIRPIVPASVAAWEETILTE